MNTNIQKNTNSTKNMTKKNNSDILFSHVYNLILMANNPNPEQAKQAVQMYMDYNKKTIPQVKDKEKETFKTLTELEQRIAVLFIATINTNKVLALQLLSFAMLRNKYSLVANAMMSVMNQKKTSAYLQTVLSAVLDYSGYDMVRQLHTTGLRFKAFSAIKKIITNGSDNQKETLGIELPKKGKTPSDKTFIKGLANWLGLKNQHEYRLLISNMSRPNHITHLMSENRWSEIPYENLSEVMLSEHHKAFIRNDKERFEKHMNELATKKRQVILNRIQDGQIAHPMIVFNNHIEALFDEGSIDRATLDKIWKASTERYTLVRPESDNKPPVILPMVDIESFSNNKENELPFSLHNPISFAASACVYCVKQPHVNGLLKDQMLLGDKFINVIKSSGKGKEFDSYKSVKNKIEKAATKSEQDEIKTPLPTVVKALHTLLNFACEVKLDKMPDSILIMTYQKAAKWLPVYQDEQILAMKAEYEEKGYKMPMLIVWSLNNDIGGWAGVSIFPNGRFINGAAFLPLNQLHGVSHNRYFINAVQNKTKIIENKWIEKEKEALEKAARKKSKKTFGSKGKGSYPKNRHNEYKSSNRQ